MAISPWSTMWRFSRSNIDPKEWVVIKIRKHDEGKQYHLFHACYGPVIFEQAYDEMRPANDNRWRAV